MINIQIVCGVLIYVIAAGMWSHWQTFKLSDLDSLREKYKDKPNELEQIDELENLIHVHFGCIDNVLPTVQYFALLLGWLLVPMAFVTWILGLFGIKIK